MMWKEFEEIAGYEVSYEDYSKVIEPMYMATNLSKRDFVKVLDRKQFDINYKRKQIEKTYTKRMKELAEEIKTLCNYTTTYEEYEELRKVAHEYFDLTDEPWRVAHHDFETARECGGCTYVKAIVWYDRNWNEIKRMELLK